MSKDNVFGRLVKDLSSEERLKMLEKLEETIHVNQDPIDISVENEDETSLEEEYHLLSWLEKLIISLKSLLFRIDRLELTKKHLLKEVVKRIYSMNSQYFNPKQESVLGAFCITLTELGKSAEFLKKPLEECLNNNKTSFYLLLGKLEFPEIHTQLETQLDPWKIAENVSALDVQEVRKKLTEEMEHIITQITREDRVRMVESTRVIDQMHRLCLFPFQRVQGQFLISAGEFLPSSFSVLGHFLNDLGKILHSFNNPPSVKLLEAVFLMYASESEQTEVSLEESMKGSMVKTAQFMERVREFNRTICLGDLLKLINGDPFFIPEDLGGGEDWFNYYQQYWQDVVSEKMKAYIRRRMIDAEKNELLRDWDASALLVLDDYSASQDFPYYAVSLAILKTFFKEIFQKVIYHPLRIVLVDGEFYKKNNRSEFEENFTSMMKLGDRIRWFENYLEPSGTGGLKMREALHEAGENGKNNKGLLKPVYDMMNREAYVIIEESLSVLFAMGRLLNGIVLGNGGTYDTLANYSELGGKSNAELRASIQASTDHVQKFSHSLQDLFNLEKEDIDE